MIRLRHVAKVIAGQSPPSSEVDELGESAGLPFVQGNAEFGPVSPTPRLQCATAPKIAQPGDVLVSVRAPVGAVNLASTELGIGRGLAAVRPSSIHGGYLRWLLVHYAEPLTAAATGTTFSAISASDIGQLLVPEQDLHLQRAIADYLDRETAQIDTLIAEQEHLLVLLQERRNAVIASHILSGHRSSPHTQGTLRRVGKFITGSTPAGASDEYFDDLGKIGWARPEDLGGRTDPSKRLSPKGEQAVRLVGPAVLVCCVGATVGKVGWTDKVVSTNQQITAILMDGQDPEFWFYALIALKDELLRLAVGNTIPILNNERLASLRVGIPERENQRRIAAIIRDSCLKIDRLHNEVQRAMKLARERRAALVTAAVTGQMAISS